MLKDNGHHKKAKYVKCNFCKARTKLDEEDIIKIDRKEYIICTKCGKEIVLKR